MATLEVHHGEGRVERVTISRDQAVLFGTSPKCDIVLNGPGVLPFHGRLRWKTSRYKADAFPDAEFLEINGHRMTSSSVRQGDEITVGPCRIFMLDVDEDLPPDDATRVQPAPVFAAGAAPPYPPPPLPRRRGPLERNDWARGAEVAPPSVEAAVATPPPTRGAEPRASGDKATEATPARGGWIRALVSGGQVAPGEERILTSPLVAGLVVALAVLVLLGIMLRGIIARTVATRLYTRAVESLDDGDYRNAMRRFDEYLASKPGDPKAEGKARVLRALANVSQFASATGASWSNALEAAREMADTVGEEPAYRDSSAELAGLVLKAGEGLAERARATADPKVLAEAESAVALHARVGGGSAGTFLKASKVPTKLEEARAAVRKQAIRAKALEAMDAAIAGGSAVGVFAARDRLVRQYGDQAGDREVVDRLTRANDLVRRAVRVDTSRRPAETEPIRDLLRPPVSLVLRSAASEKPAANGTVVFALADGFAYGVDGASGAPLWQLFVGLGAPFPPQAVPGGSTALVVDARHDELLRVDAKSGSLIWRQALGEPITDPPLLLGNQVIQSTPGGKLLLIDLPSGELRGTVHVGFPLSRTPVSDETGQFLYVLADRDCLFIFSRDPLACSAVEYLGHASGSIPCSPARLGRYLVIPENHALRDGRWRVCVLEEDGARVRQVQQVPISGWTWDTPASSGSVIWATGDRGGIAAYSVGTYEAKEPFHLIVQLIPEAKPTGPAFALARSENELWLESGRSGRYELNPEKGAIATSWALRENGPALAPIQLSGTSMVLTHQDTERAGVSLWGVDPRSGALRWRTVLGAPWVVDLAPGRDDGLTTLGADGRLLTLDRSRLAAGGFVESPLPRPGGFRLPPGPLRRLEGGGATILVPGAGERFLLVRGRDGEFRQVDLPVAPGAPPLLLGSDLLIPGGDGRVYVIDPASGESRAEPFVPPFDRDHPTRWRAPVLFEDGSIALADEAGKVRRLALVKDPRPQLTLAAEASLGKALRAEPVSTGAAVVVATADGLVRSLSARDLSPIGAWPFETAIAMPPVVVAGRAFVADPSGKVLALGQDGQRLWSATLRGGAAGPPVVKDQSVWFLTGDGVLERLSLLDGSSTRRDALGVFPAGGLRPSGNGLVVPVALGTVRLLDPNDLPKAEGAPK